MKTRLDSIDKVVAGFIRLWTLLMYTGACVSIGFIGYEYFYLDLEESLVAVHIGYIVIAWIGVGFISLFIGNYRETKRNRELLQEFLTLQKDKKKPQ